MIQVLSLIFFLSFFVSMLYYWGVLQFIVLKLGKNVVATLIGPVEIQTVSLTRRHLSIKATCQLRRNSPSSYQN
jgi:nucleoside permease NupC